MARDVACEWLERAGRPYDVALSPAFEGGVEWWSVDPSDYSEVVFVCGPAKGWQIEELAQRFSVCRLIGLDVSVIGEAKGDLPFDLLLERDGPATARPDLGFLARPEPVPVAGLILSHPQPEYGEHARHDAVHAALRRAVYARRFSVVPFDTRVDPRSEEFRSPAEVESLVARMDLVVTTRLHGMVLALKFGVPAVAVDPISGGAKISRQAEAVGWPTLITADKLSERALNDALDFCLTPEAKDTARTCAERAGKTLQSLRVRFIAALRDGSRTSKL